MYRAISNEMTTTKQMNKTKLSPSARHIQSTTIKHIQMNNCEITKWCHILRCLETKYRLFSVRFMTFHGAECKFLCMCDKTLIQWQNDYVLSESANISMKTNYSNSNNSNKITTCDNTNENTPIYHSNLVSLHFGNANVRFIHSFIPCDI